MSKGRKAMDAVAEQGGLATRWLNTTEQEAKDLARTLFGVTGAAMRFATEKDDTFRITCENDRSFVLKIANPDEDLGELDFQVALLQHIERADPTICVPRVRPSLDGLSIKPFTARDGVTRQARLMTFLDGLPLDRMTTTAAERFKIGEVLARLRLATSTFSHPADRRVLAWDVQHLMSLAPLTRHIKDPRNRQNIERALDRFATIVEPLQHTRFQVLHNDFSRSNIVASRSDPHFVTGIIDFGDAVRTSVAVDVATALLNQLPQQARPDIFAEGKDLLAGYLSIAELSDAEMSLVPHLVMGRVVARALLTIWRAELMPDNAAYILRNTEQGWSQLQWFVDRSLQQVTVAFLE